MNNKLKLLAAVLLASTINHPLATAFAQGTAFTYQGRLNDGTNPVSGIYDLRFAIYDLAGSGSQVGPVLTNSAATLANGLFTVTLDFGANIFTNAGRFMEIAVRTNGVGSFTPLNPRQKLTPAPYAIFAEHVSVGGLSAGTYGSAVTFNNAANNFSGGFTGNGSGLTNVSAATLGGISSNGFWRTTGNAGTTAGANFLGTADNQPLELRVNGSRALRIEPVGVSEVPNLIGGFYQNSAGGSQGAVIGGGGFSVSPNLVSGDFGAVLGGYGNSAGSFSVVGGGAHNNSLSPFSFFSFIGSGERNTNQPGHSVIGGGSNNVIQTGSDYSAIGGGQMNLIQTNSLFAAIAGGVLNRIGTNAGASTIGGGDENSIEPNAGSSIIGGGFGNLIRSGSIYSTVGGGFGNISDGTSSTVGGGYSNVGSGPASVVGGGSGNAASGSYATVSGGVNNTNSGNFATVPGGNGNTAAGDLSFAAGYLAKANHQGSFVWADSQFADFTSTTNDQFNVRAEGGVRFETAGAGATIDGRQIALRAGGNTFTNGQIFNGQIRLDSTGGFSQSSIGNFAVDAPFIIGGRVMVLTNGNFGIGMAAPTNKLHVLGGATFTSGASGAAQNVVWIPGSGSWSFTSDRNAKNRIQPVDTQSVLEKVSRVPIAEWSYIGYDQRHIGPMAQDFHEQFPLNSNDKALNDADLHGVALAAIQGLNGKVEATDQRAEVRIRKLEAENAELKQRLDALEKIIRN